MPKRCGAKTKSGGTCQTWAMPNGRCRLHGGKSLSGIASATWKHGRYSKVLPSRLLDRYQQATADPELLALRSEISLVDARIAELLTKLDEGESGQVWKWLQERMDDFNRANRHASNIKDEERRKAKLAEAAEALSDIQSLIARGASDWQVWGEVVSMIDTRRRLVESEQKRLVAMQQMITSERAVNYAAALGQAVFEVVKDKDQLRLINDKFRSIMSRNDLTNPSFE